MKTLDRQPPEYAKIFLKVLQGEDNRDRNQNLNRKPLTQRIKHPEDKVQGSYPNPNNAQRRELWQGEGGERALEQIWREGGKPRVPRIRLA